MINSLVVDDYGVRLPTTTRSYAQPSVVALDEYCPAADKPAAWYDVETRLLTHIASADGTPAEECGCGGCGDCGDNS